jgi:hypothetical protein
MPPAVWGTILGSICDKELAASYRPSVIIHHRSHLRPAMGASGSGAHDVDDQTLPTAFVAAGIGAQIALPIECPTGWNGLVPLG